MISPSDTMNFLTKKAGTPHEHLEAEAFPPLTPGLLTLRGGGPLEWRLWQPELRMCQPLLFSSGKVVEFRRQRLATYAASGTHQLSSPTYVELNEYA
jgi:hypothetical protein